MGYHKHLTAICGAIILSASVLVETGSAQEAADAQGSTVIERQGGDNRIIARKAELESIQRSMTVSEKRQAALQNEIDEIRTDQERLNRELIATAQRLQRIEHEIARLETRLEELYLQEDTLRASLLDRRDVLAEILSALQRMGRTPPPALLARPEDAVAAIRGSILANAVLPDIRAQAERLADDLEELTRVKTRIEDSNSRLKARYSSLGEQDSRIRFLIDAKKAQQKSTITALSDEQKRAEELAAEAKSMQSLIRKLEKEVDAAARAAKQAAASAEHIGQKSAREAQQRLLDTSRIGPAVRFSDAKGLLPMPIVGTVAMEYGDPDGLGGTAKGVSIAGRAGSPVLSPADGWVIYAGQFRSFGQVLILNAGEDYRIVLAGLDKINVEIGQFVLAGEPIAVLGEKKLAGLGKLDHSSARPMLYIEFRFKDNSIDPTPWWDMSDMKEVRG